MRRGSWHQCGDRSQKLVEEQLQQGMGVGVILSPRDLKRNKALEYAPRYLGLGAELLIDHQYHIPDYSNPTLDSYPITRFRQGVSNFSLSDTDLAAFMAELKADHDELGATALIAPAVMYQAGNQDIIQLNNRLFSAAKKVASSLNIPVYASLFLGRSVTASDAALKSVMSQATAFNADGWYFGYEFEEERIPSAQEAVKRCGATVLTLACTGKPVLHAYAGPMGLLSFGFGATGVALGHSQNLWKFTRDRWLPSNGQGGGGNAPARFFSDGLWGTIVYPDEIARLAPELRSKVLTHTPFSTAVKTNGPWDRWEANKHLVYLLSKKYSEISTDQDARKCAEKAIFILKNAVQLHSDIQQANVFLADNTNVYQENWLRATQQLLTDNAADYDFLEIL